MLIITNIQQILQNYIKISKFIAITRFHYEQNVYKLLYVNKPIVALESTDTDCHKIPNNLLFPIADPIIGTTVIVLQELKL